MIGWWGQVTCSWSSRVRFWLLYRVPPHGVASPGGIFLLFEVPLIALNICNYWESKLNSPKPWETIFHKMFALCRTFSRIVVFFLNTKNLLKTKLLVFSLCQSWTQRIGSQTIGVLDLTNTKDPRAGCLYFKFFLHLFAPEDKRQLADKTKSYPTSNWHKIYTAMQVCKLQNIYASVWICFVQNKVFFK